MNKFFTITAFLFAFVSGLTAQKQSQGNVSGVIIEKSSDKPLEFAHVTLTKSSDSTIIQNTVTDSKGKFVFEKVPAGEYRVNYSFIGFETVSSPIVTVDSKRIKTDLGRLYISETSHTLGEVEVTGRKSTFVNSIDRKSFNVGEDLMSKTGSVSELLQNVPSIQVDIDGNVSLRGSENVTILVNGKPSAMMNLNRAAILQQMPANSIEKIEVITNPSAKYKPDGTSGIINIVLKKDKSLGLNGNITANIGNNERYNSNIMLSNSQGKLTVFGNLGFRQDNRQRINDIYTTSYLDGAETSSTHNYSQSYAKPISNIAGLGLEYKFNEKNKIGASANYNYRFQRVNDVSVYTRDSLAVKEEDYNRDRYLPEFESDLELNSFVEHNFGKEGHDLKLNYTTSRSKENEDNYYTNTYRIPVSQINYDNMFYHHKNNESQFLAEYSNPLAENSTLEAGYELDYTNNDMDLHRDTTAMNQTVFTNDVSRTNRFIRSEYTHVFYLTYEREMGKFGFLGGLRAEQTNTKANLVSKDMVINSQYSRLYPSLHLTYKIKGPHELQLNYSHRINRPEDEQLNPFPEYQDMLNIRVGNPYLKPEDIHSFEFGYQFKKQSTTFISTLYYRYNLNGITSIARVSGDTIISSLQNLSRNTSAGLKLMLTLALVIKEISALLVLYPSSEASITL